MLSDNTVRRSARLVASRATAKRGPGQSVRIHRSNGAKQVVTSSSRRWSPDLSSAALYQSRSRSRRVWNEPLRRGTKTVTTAVKPQERARTMPKLQRARTAAWGWLKWGKWVVTVCVQSESGSRRDMAILLSQERGPTSHDDGDSLSRQCFASHGLMSRRLLPRYERSSRMDRETPCRVEWEKR